MKMYQAIACELLIFSLLASASGGTPSDKLVKSTAPPAHAPFVKMFATRQLSFEPLPREGDDPVRFSARGPGYSLSVAPAEAELFLWRSEASATNARRADVKASERSLSRLRMKLVGANAKVAAAGVDQLPGQANYFSGSDPAKWRTRIPTYAKVKCPQVYPGVDLVYYGNARQLEFDFVVAPGADPRQIALAFEGVDNVGLADNGDLVLRTGAQEFRQHKPLIYQTVNGARTAIAGGFKLNGNQEARFEIAAYDHAKPLVIDPTLSYSTYLGGTDSEIGTSVAVDPMGNVYIVGTTRSFDFPTLNPFQPVLGGLLSAFVAKFSPSGSLIYSTYLGGSSLVGDNGYSLGLGIAVDAAGNAYVTGQNSDAEFPTTANALQPISLGYDAFVTKLNPTGSVLVYSTFLGGDANDIGIAIAVDSDGNAYVTGGTASDNFPVTPGAVQTTSRGGGSPWGFVKDVFVAKVNPTGSALVYSTYLGGSRDEFAQGIAVDAAGNVYVTGETASIDFPTTAHAFQRTFGGGQTDFFIAKLNASGSALAYSTYLGGELNEQRLDAGGIGSGSGGIAIDSQGNAYVTGHTSSGNFPTKNALQASRGGNPNIIVTKLNSDGSDLIYSTYLGCGGNCLGGSIAVDPDGNAYVTGGDNTRFPTINAFQSEFAGGGLDAIIAKLSADGTALRFATYLGGSGYDAGQGIALDAARNAYVVGWSSSPDFPVTPDAIQSTYGGDAVSGWNGGGDAFLAKISPGAEPPAPAPTINCPPNIATGPDSGQTTALVNYSVSAASSKPEWVYCMDVTCKPPSGSAFPFGATTVNCTVKDAVGGTAACSFTVTVINPNPVTITCPAAIVRSTDSGQCSAIVTYAPSASGGSGTPMVNCIPASGSAFPKGSTLVTCTVGQISASEAAGTISTIAGNGTAGFSGDGGPATSASLNRPVRIAVDRSGNLFVADEQNQCIRKVDVGTGMISTVAGTGTAGFSGDGGPAASASLNYPSGVTLDSAGNIFICDSSNNRIRRVDASTGIITTWAGNGLYGYGSDGISATAPGLAGARLALAGAGDVAVDSVGNLFIADTANQRIRRVDAHTGIITTVAGTGAAGFSGDGGQATSAQLNGPWGVGVDNFGNLFITDLNNNRIRQMTISSGTINTVAGNGISGFNGDGILALSASLTLSFGNVSVDSAGNLFFEANNRIRRVDAMTGFITTVAGTGNVGFSGDGSSATSATVNGPVGTALDSFGNLFIADTLNNRIRRVSSGNSSGSGAATCSFTVTVNDTEKPQITCPANVSIPCSVDFLVSFPFSVTATDNCDPSPTVTSIPVSGLGFPVGTSTVTSTARDNGGNTATCSFTVTRAPLGFTGFLSPIGGADASGGSFASPLRAFKSKSTIPVKFTSACGGAAVLSGIHTLQVIKYADATTAGDPIDATPQDSATTGDEFRLTGSEWHFNLDTKATGMSVGIWQLLATLSDGSQHHAWIQIK